MRTFTSTLIVLLFGCIALCPAAEPSPSAQHLKFLQPMVGDWRIFFSLDGQEMEGEFHCKWAPGRYCLVWTAQSRSSKPDQPAVHHSGIITWDPATQRAKELAAQSDGALAEAWFDMKGGKLVIERTGITPDGVKFRTRPVGTFSPDRLEFQGSDWTDDQGNVIQQFGPSRFERIKKKPKKAK